MRRRLQRWSFLVAALPAAVLALSMPQDIRLPQLKTRAAPPPALFSHWAHQSNQCFGCHPSIFPQASLGVTHAQMQAGQFCGACHDGHITRAMSTMRCEECHAPR
jgi:c(7)-type cytochrome triheme protein